MASTHRTVSVCGKEQVVVGRGVITSFLKEDLKKVVTAAKFVVITDENIAHLPHLQTLQDALKQAGIPASNVLLKVVPPGEHSKCRSMKEDIEDWMLECGCNRDTCVIALGGGVVGDLSGFVASTFMRGVPFIQIPTTLLAMVDSSVGGKTGVDTPAGKNLIGAFHQPARVYIDPLFLATLPQREISNGMAEVIKTFCFRDANLFRELEDEANVKSVFSPGSESGQAFLEHIAYESVKVKADVVTQDETESSGIRSLLNFGHTIGHAIEALKDGEMLHGECVAIGMVKEAEVACALNHIKFCDIHRLSTLLKAYRLPTVLPDDLALDDLMRKMEVDKKNVGGKKKCVLLKGIGEVVEQNASTVEDDLMRIVLSPTICVVPLGPISGAIRVPGSKSISNRVLLLAAMGKGDCKLRGLLNSDDTEVMMDALKKLQAATFEWVENHILLVKGSQNGGSLVPPEETIYLGNAGTAARFLTTLCTLVEGDVTITGNSRMRERPISDLVDALRTHQGCNITYLGTEGCLPLKIHGSGLPGKTITLSASVSSQFVSSILLSAPFAKEEVKLCLDASKTIVSQPYIDMTVNVARSFGITIHADKATNTYTVPVQRHTNPPLYDVECDASSATYPLAMAAITGGSITALNLGTTSVQGDSKFYTVLQAMGCDTEQTESCTRVSGPSGRLKAVEWDMGDMTDAFMTVAVLAAVADGTSRITGIANQRVKECNRIAVMLEELSKCGVSVVELEDGLEIVGKPAGQLHGASIECHNDHRIAMSFAVLGCVVPGIVLLDKACTQKTYPEFWFDLLSVFKLKLTPLAPTDEAHTSAAPAIPSSISQHEASVFIIGMRGAGKTNQGRALAAHLGWKFVDVDLEIEEAVGQSVKDYVKEKGWKTFRDTEYSVFASIASKNPVRCVVSCGGGIVETPAACTLLKALHNVVFVNRNFDDISNFLNNLDGSRPSFADQLDEVYNRRLPLYRKLSHYEFVIPRGDADWKAIQSDFLAFCDRALLSKAACWPALEPSPATPSFFLSFTFPDVKAVSSATIQTLQGGVNAVELRADLLSADENPFEQLALLRRHVRLPIIFTVRSKTQGGAFPDNEGLIFNLLHMAVKQGCEYVDMEACWSAQAQAALISAKRASRIISSFHYYEPDGAQPAVIRRLLHRCWHNGTVDVVKVVIKARSHDDCLTLHRIVEESRRYIQQPVIALCTGEQGRLSRVLNTYMTPVTHPELPSAAAPGQLSVKEINALRASLGMVSARQFFLFGSPIARSPSPRLHNTLFAAVGLPHTYALCETDSVEEVKARMADGSFGGASVTIPLKQDVLPLAAVLSDAARAIGAVNTLYPTPMGVCGDNTDWLGIRDPILSRLHARAPARSAVVIGAGGTARAACYALSRLGASVHVFNRTASKAAALAAEFGAVACEDLASLTQVDVVVSTVPLAAQASLSLPPSLFADMPVCLDAVYQPQPTPFLAAAAQHGCPVVEGIEMLHAQGVRQFELFTGLASPPLDFTTLLSS